MSVHMHRARQWTACMLGAAALSPLALGVGMGPSLGSSPPSIVTGRVAYAGRPLGDMTLCLDQDGHHLAYAALRPDGSFRLVGMNWTEGGARPGRYRVHLYTHKDGPRLPSRYADPSTSGIELRIHPGWNDFGIDLK